MSKELRCTAWCHSHHLPLRDGASGPRVGRIPNLLLMSLLMQVLQNLTPYAFTFREIQIHSVLLGLVQKYLR